MMPAISPRLAKFAALVMLLVAVWGLFSVASRLVAARLALQAEIRDLTALYHDISVRRIDIPSLEGDLSRLAVSETATSTTILADSERAAFARLQQLVRKGVDDAGGQLLSMNESGVSGGASPNVTTQVRVRIGDPALSRLLARWEDGAPHLDVQDYSITSRTRQTASASDLELVATVRARWALQKGRTP
jgi:hypothetical protein